jgi:hypothetical protein
MYLKWQIQEFLIGMGARRRLGAALKPLMGVQRASPPEADKFLQVKGDFEKIR